MTKIYFDRTLGKDVRIPYKKKTKVKKERYTSKAYRNYLDYLNYHFGPFLLPKLMAEQMRILMNRQGFFRSFLQNTTYGPNKPFPEYKGKPWYQAYTSMDPGEYKRKKAYTCPNRGAWTRWKDPTEPNLSMSSTASLFNSREHFNALYLNKAYRMDVP